ncbi:hypothetical protein [Brevibacillus sp. SIMBA_040]
MTDQTIKERKLLLQEVEGLLSLITLPILVVDTTGIQVIRITPIAFISVVLASLLTSLFSSVASAGLEYRKS